MTPRLLSQYFSLNRRYSRSINLERDIEVPEAVSGYVPTERSVDTLKRIFAALTKTQSTRAWTLTGVYGTGKSAFAHYLASLCAPEGDLLRLQALNIAEKALGSQSFEYLSVRESLPKQGFFRAVATAQREPLSHAIVRALQRGSEIYWRNAGRAKPAIAAELVDLDVDTGSGTTIDSRRIASLVQEVAIAAKTDVLLIIDEMGKTLEFASQNEGVEDLYLLQQLAELSRKEKYQVYIIGLLHQSFVDYGQRLATAERNEWAKIQGRFEDIPFIESPLQMTRLIGQAICRSQAAKVEFVINQCAEEWFECLQSAIGIPEITPKVLADAYPLHPITSLVLPMLCARYAQNDRSLFTFLTSSEPYSFKNFLDETALEGNIVSTLKLHWVFDYFVESVGIGASRSNIQRWVEIQGLVADAKHFDRDSQRVLKTIGTLNLITSISYLRATRPLVVLALCEKITDKEQQTYWQQIIDQLLEKGVITYRKQLDELRIWEGSDFDIEGEISSHIEKERLPLAHILSTMRPLKPLVAQRHSYKTGTLRYFERQYFDASNNLSELHCSNQDSDGLIGYWVDEKLPPHEVPAQTLEGKPFLMLCATKLNVLQPRVLEFTALRKIQTSASQLQTDGIARREVRQRLFQAERLLDETLDQAFDVAEGKGTCWIQGKKEVVIHITTFNARLSDVCDSVYDKGLILWNELINRRELTTQGAKARRELIEAMLDCFEQERLGLQGNGPEVSMYASLLSETGIHRQKEGTWGFFSPLEKGVLNVWEAIEAFCTQTDKLQPLSLLYQRLEAPPYGVKRGAIPVLLAAALIQHVDDVSIYKDGTFIPVLGAEHFELLVKDPSRFSVKYFEVAGLRAQVFQELEAILRKPNAQIPAGIRNVTILTVVKPLFQFVKKLPTYTTKTKRIGPEAQAVLKILLQAQEPDELLFTALPKACGFSPIVAQKADDGTTAKRFRKKLVEVLHEIQTAYEHLLNECQTLLYNAFSVRSDETKLREDLRVRASYLLEQCIEPTLQRFILAATDERATDQQWLEALLMIVADKPAESWNNEDVTSFEIKLSSIARRFKNLEALQKDVAATKAGGFEARRITITRPDGHEVHRMVWMEYEQQEQVNSLVNEILEKSALHDNANLLQAIVAKLTEKVFSDTPEDEISETREKNEILIEEH